MELPTKWVICSTCQGDGKSSAYLGAYTQSEWQEQDEDFRRDYVAGHYDRTCDRCGGSGKEIEVDEDCLTPEQKRLWEAWVEEEIRYRSIERMERMMGA